MGGESVHVGDCHVWAEISYLDSPTDYRELLPVASQSRITGNLVMLDDEPIFPRLKKWREGLRVLIMNLETAKHLARSQFSGVKGKPAPRSCAS